LVMAVNERIRQVREALRMSKTDFSKAICVSNSYAGEIESGYRAANDRIIRLICLTFGASEPWLKTGEGKMFATSPPEKSERIQALFSELRPEFQEFALAMVDRLLLLQGKKPETP